MNNLQEMIQRKLGIERLEKRQEDQQERNKALMQMLCLDENFLLFDFILYALMEDNLDWLYSLNQHFIDKGWLSKDDLQTYLDAPIPSNVGFNCSGDFKATGDCDGRE